MKLERENNMRLNLRIYREGNFFKEVPFIKQSGDIFIYLWRGVEEEGTYTFKISDKIGREDEHTLNVSFSHTAPFSKTFEAFTTKNEIPKPISGFRKSEDVLIVYQKNENRFFLKKMRFTRYVVDVKRQFNIENAKKVEMPSSFNSWNLFATELTKLTDTLFETYLALDDGVYEYKLVIDGNWHPYDHNLKLVVGDMGWLFPEGQMGSGHFVYDAKNPLESRKAIYHDELSLSYLNRVSEDEIEINIRTQRNDIEKVLLHLKEAEGEEEIYEMDRIIDNVHSFDIFKKIIKLRINKNKFKYFFELIDGGNTAYYTSRKLGFERPVSEEEKNQVKEKLESIKNISTIKNEIEAIENSLKDRPAYIEVDYSKGIFPVFSVPKWAKEAVWYNIFPERFYNGNPENNPIYNEFGPEHFEKPNDLEKARLIEEYKWGKVTTKYGKFELNEWTSDFEKQTQWEKLNEMDIDYSLKYARMYGGDLRGIKEKIPYLKELGITAIWLNPIFFSTSNHKYGAADFRHASPDFGTIKTSGSLHNVEISKNNKYGNKSYIDILGENSKGQSELKLLNIKTQGKDKYKNSYGETEDPSTWVWTESDLIAVDLIKELHKNGIRVIFDGVFNHSGTAHWAFEAAMAEGKNSKYAKWYKFHDFSKHKEIKDTMTEEEAYRTLIHNKHNVHYSGWAGFGGLPEFNSYNEEFKEYIFNITRKWMLGPDGKKSENWKEDDGIDGWRLDVPNCLENQDFWHEWRKVVKACKDDGYITAELWGDARGEINEGIKYDTVMNYEWLKTTIGYFINQGHNFDRGYKLKATEFFRELAEKRYWYPLQALQVSQNLNGSHDTDRLISRIVNDKLGRDLEEGKQLNKGYLTIRPDLADGTHPNTSINWTNSVIKPKDILKLISVFQMTYIGAPMLYYGDEIGMWGATDPYDRKPMIWDEFEYENETDGTMGVKEEEREKYEVKADKELFEWYKKIIKIRNENKVLIYGDFKEVMADNVKDIISYMRYDDENEILVVINNSFRAVKNIELSLEQEAKYIDLLSNKEYKTDVQGSLKLNLDKKQGLILKKL